MKTLLKAEIILLLACLLYCFAPLRCEAAEYRITEVELTRLETNLTTLQQLNNQSQAELQTLKTQLANSKAELQTLNNQLYELKVTSKRQENSLQTANELLEKYEQEQKEKQRSLERQRNVAYLLCAALLYVAVR